MKKKKEEEKESGIGLVEMFRIQFSLRDLAMNDWNREYPSRMQQYRRITREFLGEILEPDAYQSYRTLDKFVSHPIATLCSNSPINAALFHRVKNWQNTEYVRWECVLVYTVLVLVRKTRLKNSHNVGDFRTKTPKSKDFQDA